MTGLRLPAELRPAPRVLERPTRLAEGAAPDGEVETLAVSVVVPTYRRPELLDHCLAALLVQDFDPRAYEVIVVDGAASEATRQQVGRWAQVAPVPLLYVPAGSVPGPAAARNLGWRIARGSLIAFTEDDCCPESNWLPVGVAAFVADTAAVGGTVATTSPDSPRQSELPRANLFCRREVLARFGGFDEQFTLPSREDADLHFTLLEAGLAVRHVPEACVWHAARPASWATHLRAERQRMFHALLYKKHPALYRRKVQAMPPWGHYARVGALVGAGVAALAGLAVALEVCVVLWLILTLELADRRLRDATPRPGQVLEEVLTSAVLPPLAVFWRLWGAMRFRVFFL
jgi:GT2 family glycosyltransferase